MGMTLGWADRMVGRDAAEPGCLQTTLNRLKPDSSNAALQDLGAPRRAARLTPDAADPRSGCSRTPRVAMAPAGVEPADARSRYSKNGLRPAARGVLSRATIIDEI